MLNYADVLAKGAAGSIREEPLDCHDHQYPVSQAAPPAARRALRFTHHNVVNNARFIAQALNSARRIGSIPVPLSLLRNGSGGSRLRKHGRDHGIPGRKCSIPPRSWQRFGGALHGTARGANDVHRELAHPISRPSTCLLCGRGSWPARRAPPKPCGRWSPRLHMSEVTIALRHDGDVTGILPELDDRPAGTTCNNGRAYSATS